MSVSYRKLFELLEQKKIKKIDLRNKYNFNPKTVDYLVKNKPITLENVEKLCRLLDCGVDDILDFVDEM